MRTVGLECSRRGTRGQLVGSAVVGQVVEFANLKKTSRLSPRRRPPDAVPSIFFPTPALHPETEKPAVATDGGNLRR